MELYRGHYVTRPTKWLLRAAEAGETALLAVASGSALYSAYETLGEVANNQPIHEAFAGSNALLAGSLVVAGLIESAARVEKRIHGIE